MDSLTKRWIKSAADEYAASIGCYFDEAAALHVVDFFPTFLRHSKGQKWGGKPFDLLPWQRDDIVMPLFGWKRADGYRRYRVAYIEIPKKNGKSTLASGIGLYMLTGDGEPGAEIYSAAVDVKQASIVHGEAINMINASPHLASALSINKTNFNISYPETMSYYRALTGEAGSKEGLNAHAMICDEIHVWKGRGLFDTLKYAGRARTQPLLFIITTAGEDMASVCYEQHKYGLEVNAGLHKDARFFTYIRSADEDDDWTQPETWYKANPSLGVTIDVDEFAAECLQAKATPGAQATFRRYGLNVWCQSTNPWLPLDAWANCNERYDEKTLTDEVCYGGLDLSKTRDFTSFALVFPFTDEIYRQLVWFWLPHDSVFDPGAYHKLKEWAADGSLIVTDGVTCDYNQVERDIARICQQFKCRQINYDPRFASEVTQKLDEVHGIPREPFAQTIVDFAAPTSEYERLVLAGKMRHNGHSILTWQAGHVEVKQYDNGYKRPHKPNNKDDYRKIDGIVAAIMALRGCMDNAAQGPSVYEGRGVVSF